MKTKTVNLISAISLFLVFCIALMSSIVTATTTGYFLPADITFLFTSLLSSVMFLWALRVPMHAKAGAYISVLGLIGSSIIFGTNYLNGTGLSAYYMSAGILDYVAAFFLFDALVLMTHFFLRAFNFKRISIVMFGLAACSLIAIAILRLIFEAGDMGIALILSTISLFTSAIVVPGIGVITILSERK